MENARKTLAEQHPARPYEAFEPGQRFRSASVPLTQEKIRQFAQLTGDHNPIHLDAAFAARTIHRGVIAHGLLVSGMAAGMAYDLGLLGPGILALESSESTFFKAARPGDVLYGTVEILVTDPEAGRRVGRVVWDTRVWKELEGQDDRELARVQWTTLVFKEAFLPKD